MSLNGLRTRFEEMSNGDLAKVISTYKSQYTKEALDIAIQVFEERGLKTSETEQVIVNENEVLKREAYENRILEKMNTSEKRIDLAVFLSALTGITVLILSLVTLIGIQIMNSSIWGIVDALIILSLSYGVRKKSRICALLMTMYAVTALYFNLSLNSQTNSMIGLRIIIYILGFMGTLSYHKYKREHERITCSNEV